MKVVTNMSQRNGIYPQTSLCATPHHTTNNWGFSLLKQAFNLTTNMYPPQCVQKLTSTDYHNEMTDRGFVRLDSIESAHSTVSSDEEQPVNSVNETTVRNIQPLDNCSKNSYIPVAPVLKSIMRHSSSEDQSLKIEIFPNSGAKAFSRRGTPCSMMFGSHKYTSGGWPVNTGHGGRAVRAIGMNSSQFSPKTSRRRPRQKGHLGQKSSCRQSKPFDNYHSTYKPKSDHDNQMSFDEWSFRRKKIVPSESEHHASKNKQQEERDMHNTKGQNAGTISSYAQALKVRATSPKCSRQNDVNISGTDMVNRTNPASKLNFSIDLKCTPKQTKLSVLQKSMNKDKDKQYDQKDRLQYKRIFEERRDFLRAMKDTPEKTKGQPVADDGHHSHICTSMKNATESDDSESQPPQTEFSGPKSPCVNFVVGAFIVDDSDESWSDDDDDDDSGAAIDDSDLLSLFAPALTFPSHNTTTNGGGGTGGMRNVASAPELCLLQTLNQAWNQYIDRDTPETPHIKLKKVHFPPDDSLEQRFEWSDEEEDAKARKGHWEEFARDRCRFQRKIQECGDVISPVLAADHREMVYNLYHAPPH